MLLPIVVTMAIGAPIIGKLLDKFGSKNIMITGSFIMSAGPINARNVSRIILSYYYFQGSWLVLE